MHTEKQMSVFKDLLLHFIEIILKLFHLIVNDGISLPMTLFNVYIILH